MDGWIRTKFIVFPPHNLPHADLPDGSGAEATTSRARNATRLDPGIASLMNEGRDYVRNAGDEKLLMGKRKPRASEAQQIDVRKQRVSFASGSFFGMRCKLNHD